MYELIILKILMIQSAHGYMISRVINDIIGPYAKVSNGRMYPLLARLEETGLIEAYEDGGEELDGKRPLRPYKITSLGKQRFLELMLDTTSNPGEYQRIFQEKLTGLKFISPAQRRHLLEHYVNYCQTHILHLEAEASDKEMLDKQHQGLDVESILEVMRHRSEQWQLELAWVKRLQTKYLDEEPKSSANYNDYREGSLN